MSSLRPQDRKSLCRFTFADGRQCRTPRCPHHPHFCSDHAAKTLKPAPPINSPANCPISSPANTFPPAISAPPSAASCPPSSAATLSPAPPDLSQTLAQTIHLTEHEYTNAFGDDSWRRAIRNSVRQNFNHRQASPPPQPPPDQAPAVVAGLQTGGGQAPQPPPASQPAPSPRTSMPPTSNEFIQHVVAGLQTGEKSSLP